MFRFLFGNKRPASPSTASFRPRLEDLEGRALPSGLAPMTQPVQTVPQAGHHRRLPAIDLRGSMGSMPNSPQGGTVLQGQLRTAIAGQGGRVDLQQVGKLVIDAVQREANALWGNKVAAGRLQIALGEITQSDHRVLVKFRLNDVLNGEVKAYRGFEVQIKYDDKGAVTAECNFRLAWGRSFFLPFGQNTPFVQNMNKALGGPLWVDPPLAEGFL
jgi:hypothetical protein